jgi:hypothetical protein
MTELGPTLKISIWAAAIIAASALLIFFARIHHKKLSIERKLAKQNYLKALEYFLDNPDDGAAKKECFRLGDEYFHFKLPDYFYYPIPDFDSHIDHIDNHKLREELINQDIEKALAARKEAGPEKKIPA